MPTVSTETARVPEDLSGRQRRMPVGGITWRHTFRALRHRNYRLFFWGQLVSLIGTWMQQTAMMWFVYDRTNSKLLLGVVAALGSAPMLFSSVWGGSLVGCIFSVCVLGGFVVFFFFLLMVFCFLAFLFFFFFLRFLLLMGYVFFCSSGGGGGEGFFY